MRRYLLNKSGQGTTEYIVILAIVVAIAITVVKTDLMNALGTKVKSIALDVSRQ